MKRTAQPDDVAELAQYLASTAADHAAALTRHGGLRMNRGQGA